MLSVAPLIDQGPLRAESPYVLLVDDHMPSLKRLCEIVEGAGHPCVMAASATEALTYCDARRPQVVVTDLSMPNLDGRGLASWLSARFPSMPLILMTGQSLDASALESLNRTFLAVLPKPVDIDWFLKCLDRLMPQSGIPTRP
jgi:CheY-like chemotaxis protein